MGRGTHTPVEHAISTCVMSPHCRWSIRRLAAHGVERSHPALWIHAGPFGDEQAPGVYHPYAPGGERCTQPMTIRTSARFARDFAGYSLDILGFCDYPEGVPSKPEAFTIDGARRRLWVVRKVAWLPPDGPYVRLDVGLRISEHRHPAGSDAENATLYYCRALVHNGKFPVGHPSLYREPEGLVKARQAVALYASGEVTRWPDVAAAVGIVERHINRLRKQHNLDAEYASLPGASDGRVDPAALADWIERGSTRRDSPFERRQARPDEDRTVRGVDFSDTRPARRIG